MTLVHYILLCMNSVEKTYWHVFLHLEAPLKSIHVNFCNVTAVTLLQSSAGFWSTLLFFLFIGVKLMFVRPFKFNSFKKLWTTPPKIWTYYIIYCQSSGYLTGYLVETYLHREGSVYVWISPAWFNTKYLSSPPSLWIQ